MRAFTAPGHTVRTYTCYRNYSTDPPENCWGSGPEETHTSPKPDLDKRRHVSSNATNRSMAEVPTTNTEKKNTKRTVEHVLSW